MEDEDKRLKINASAGLLVGLLKTLCSMMSDHPEPNVVPVQLSIPEDPKRPFVIRARRGEVSTVAMQMPVSLVPDDL
jgi:hypothetical protein